MPKFRFSAASPAPSSPAHAALSAPPAGATGYRGAILHCLASPDDQGKAWHEYIDDGLLVVADGRVHACGAYASLCPVMADLAIKDYRGHLLVPGFIDTHIHYPQAEMIGAYGEQLLQWLTSFTYPTEGKYKDYPYARRMAEFFLDELLRNGTTSALVFAAVQPASVDALFDAALARGLRLITGKVLMDRNAPAYLLDTATSAYEDSRALISKWHGKGRLGYAVTPRFAATSTPAQLAVAGRLKSEFPDVYLQTHLCENKSEISWVQTLFPERQGYLDVYHHYGLTGERSVFAHGIHLSDAEVDLLAATKSVVAFCPTSNLFLGSGLFPYRRYMQRGLRIGLGTDVGAGTSFSMLKTVGEAYKVNQLQGSCLPAMEGLYLATLGGARALSLDSRLGNFLPGKEADFVVLNPRATALSALRYDQSPELEQKLFSLMMLGDDRHVAATYVAGRLGVVKK